MNCEILQRFVNDINQGQTNNTLFNNATISYFNGLNGEHLASILFNPNYNQRKAYNQLLRICADNDFIVMESIRRGKNTIIQVK